MLKVYAAVRAQPTAWGNNRGMLKVYAAVRVQLAACGNYRSRPGMLKMHVTAVMQVAAEVIKRSRNAKIAYSCRSAASCMM